MQTILIDMDGVLVAPPPEDPEALVHWSDVPGSFRHLKPMPGAVEAFHRIRAKYNVFIVTTAPRRNPSAWTEKVLWVQEYLGFDAIDVLVLTHHKNIVQGDIIIDDRDAHGVKEFKGTWIQFGSPEYKTWDQVLALLRA